MIANFIHYKMNSSLDIFKKRFSVFKAFKSEGILKSESSEQIKKKDLKRNNSDLNEKKNVKEIDILKDKYHYIRGSVQKDEDGQVKLVSPYGNYCGFEGGKGSGGCVFTGPYKSLLLPKEFFSEDSFETTSFTETERNDLKEEKEKVMEFKNLELVWAKQIYMPWFPGIIIDPREPRKCLKTILKEIDAPLFSMEELDSKEETYELTVVDSKVYFVHLFNKKKDWTWIPVSKLRPFDDHNNSLYSECREALESKYGKELDKGFAKACKLNEYFAKKKEEKNGGDVNLKKK